MDTDAVAMRRAISTLAAVGKLPGADNPINVVTGNKYQMEVDLPTLPGELGLEIVRHHDRPDGLGWENSSHEQGEFAFSAETPLLLWDRAQGRPYLIGVFGPRRDGG